MLEEGIPVQVPQNYTLADDGSYTLQNNMSGNLTYSKISPNRMKFQPGAKLAVLGFAQA